MSNRRVTAEATITLPTLHLGQVKAFVALREPRFKALRCGRRFGKTDFAKTWIMQGLTQGQECAWFAPQHMTWAEVYSDLIETLQPILDRSSKTEGVMRLRTGGRLDFWTLENPIAGRGRRYHRVAIDEAAFAKDGDNKVDGTMMSLWEKAIKPTLYDYGGEALVCSNSAGKNPDNFFYNICTDPKYGFREFHATTMDNPLLPKRLQHESIDAWRARRAQYQADLIGDNDPLVYQQEYLAAFVDWSGVAFFSREKLLDQGQPVPDPSTCESVFAVIDTASKTGTDNDATAVTYFALNRQPGRFPLVILDWDIAQIEGAILEAWLPSVFHRLEELARLCRARSGTVGAFIEDKNSGTILLQQAQRRGMRAHAIDSKLTAMGKDERAINVSGYVHRGEVKYSDYAFAKTSIYKQKSRNHLLDQVESFRVGDKKSDREDDALDTFCYGIAIALGNQEGF
jgi:phage terminase large subunit-like protein